MIPHGRTRMRLKARNRSLAMFRVGVTILSCLPAVLVAEGTEPLHNAESRSFGIKVGGFYTRENIKEIVV